MKFTAAIESYVADMYADGRFASRHTELAYRTKLERHAEDVGNRHPAKTGRADVKRTLARWPNVNSRRQAHAILRSFYDWCCEEGIRESNPARQVRAARRRDPQVFRMTREEVVRVLDCAQTGKESFAVALGVLAGARSQELRGLQGRHFRRAGWVWISGDIAKGGRERWVPVLPELVAIVDEILLTVGRDEFVICSAKVAGPSAAHFRIDRRDRPLSAGGLYKLVGRVGERADLPAPITPHSLRHAFGDHVARYAGLRAAQALLGHASVETTAGTYTDGPSLDELAVSVQGFTYRRLSPRDQPATPHG